MDTTDSCRRPDMSLQPRLVSSFKTLFQIFTAHPWMGHLRHLDKNQGQLRQSSPS